MSNSRLSVKRRPAKQPVFRKLFANVRRKQKASVAAPAGEVEGDVPNLGIARALVVILVLHVIAIAGMFAHSKLVDRGEETATVNAAVIQPAKPLRDAGESLPKIQTGDETYMPVAGDTYRKIAGEYGVTELALREANENIEIRPGRILRVPQREIVAVPPNEYLAANGGGVVLENADALPDEESAPAPVAIPVDELRSAPMVETNAARTGTLVKPNVRPDGVASAPAAATPAPAARMTGSYTVKSGDTFWKIARAHGTTPDVIMKANGISDAKKLKIGMTIRVP